MATKIVLKLQSLSDNIYVSYWIMFLALSIKIIFLVFLHHKAPNTDGIRYLQAAQAFADGNFSIALKIYPMPAYPFLINIFHTFIPDWLLAARTISAISYICTTIILYNMTKELFDQRAAFWASLVFILIPFQNEMTILVYRGPIYLLSFSLSMYMMVIAIKYKDTYKIFFAAFLGTLPMIFRIEGFFLPFAFIVFTIILSIFSSYKKIKLISGVGIWIFFIIVSSFLFNLKMDKDITNFNRIEEIQVFFDQFIDLNFLNHYDQISDRLKNLEKSSSMPSEDQNLAEIARQFMWLLYLIGLIQTLIKAIFPLYIIPLFFAQWKSLKTEHFFFFWIIFCYLLLLYYSLIVKDFTNTRFVFTAAFLFLPWIGSGLNRLSSWVQKSRSSQVLCSLFLICFLCAPVYANLNKFETPDQSSIKAGQWLKTNGLEKARIIGNDPRIPFEAGLTSLHVSKQYIQYRPEDRNYSNIEKRALKTNRDLIMLKLRKNKLHRLPELEQFFEIKRFEHGPKVLFVFASHHFIENLPPSLNLDMHIE